MQGFASGALGSLAGSGFHELRAILPRVPWVPSDSVLWQVALEPS